MPTTRKKVLKTVYEDKDSEDETGDFSDSGSEAQISEPPSSDEEEIEANISSAEEFDSKSKKNKHKQPVKRAPKFAKKFLGKINKQAAEIEESDAPISQFSVKDLTDNDKLLPSVLNLSESDSSDDETPKASSKKTPSTIPYTIQEQDESDNEAKEEYSDVWAKNLHDNSAEVAKKTFMELEEHKNTMEETKASLQNYVARSSVEQEKESNVTDLLALGEEVAPKKSPVKKKTKSKRRKDDSDSEVEDWEEVKESKAIPQQGLQLVVALPDSVCRKSKTIDVEMMMKRKINRVKKEHQVFMHKVHVLCWIGHGNYVNRVLNDQEIMSAVLAMVPKGCYPENRLNMKYVEQITTWFKDKLTLKQDKYEHKFRPKAPPLKTILLDQIKNRCVTAKKYSVFIFVAMLRALGLQSRIMFNFVTVPLKPPISELCSLAMKPKDKKSESSDKKEEKAKQKPKTNRGKSKAKSTEKLPQVDGIDDSFLSNDSEFENIMQLDGNDDVAITKTLRSTRAKKAEAVNTNNVKEEGVSPPKRSRKEPESTIKTALKTNTIKKREPPKLSQSLNINRAKGDNSKNESNTNESDTLNILKSPKSLSLKKVSSVNKSDSTGKEKSASPRKTRSNTKITTQANTTTSSDETSKKSTAVLQSKKKLNPPNIIIADENQIRTQSKYFENSETNKEEIKGRTTRKRSHTTVATGTQKSEENKKNVNAKARTRSASGAVETSNYFDKSKNEIKKPKLSAQQLKKQEKLQDLERVCHRDLPKLRATQSKTKLKNDVTGDLVNIIKGRIKGAKEEAKKGIVKGKLKEDSDNSDYLPVEDVKHCDSESDEDFKPMKISPRASKLTPGAVPSTSKKHIDRRVLSSDDEATRNIKVDVWCEIFVEELEQWIAVDVIKGKVHCTGDLYSHTTHPLCYVIGWDNNNYLKDLTRRYVPHWNTVTRKQRAEPQWWNTAVQPWLGPRTARDREEDESLDRMQLEAPLPKSIAEYKNHPLYALKRHLLKYEALYPADAAVLGFVRKEPVYARECVYVCRSRDTWLKEAKVVKLGEKPYKIVKARPKWDRLSNKCITDKPLEVFGPWQVQDYEPPTAENGVVPRNAYGNVELFKDCMLPKGTVHIKLPGLNKVARKLNIDCAPAMTGFDFNGGWSHPVYDGFVVCEEFEEIVTEAWVKDQEDQERREREKVELRVYGNWKRLIKGLLIRERLKLKYGFEEPSTSQAAKNKGPRLVVKRRS